MTNHTEDTNPKAYYGHALTIEASDQRHQRWQEQRIASGYDETETWDLNTTLCSFFIPRLETFIEMQERPIKEHWEGYYQEFHQLLEALKAYKEDSWNEKALETIQHLLPKLFPYMWW